MNQHASKGGYAMFCPNCGQQVTGKFCTNCGTRLDLADQVADAIQDVPQVEEQIPNLPPEAPVFGAAAEEPIYNNIPEAPVYQQPVEQPVYQPPVEQPVYQQQVYQAPQQPVYQAPASTYQQPEQPKKKSKAGKIVLIVLLAVFVPILILGIIVAVLIGKALKSVDKPDSYLTPDEPAIVEVQPTVPTPIANIDPEPTQQDTPVSADHVNIADYTGYLFVYVDNAEYGSDGSIAIDITLENYTNYGIDNIREMIVKLYDQNDEYITRGGFYFFEDYTPGHIIEAGDTITMHLVFNDDSAATDIPQGLDLTGCDTNFELMCDMYDENDKFIGTHYETVLFGVSVPAECGSLINYDFENRNYWFYDTGNDDYGGELFRVNTYDSYGAWDDSETYIGSGLGYEFTVSYPTDVQYGSDPKLKEEYENLQQYVPEIVESITLF